MNGKGSKQRPHFIPLHEYADRYAKTFPCGCREVSLDDLPPGGYESCQHQDVDNIPHTVESSAD